MIAHSLTDEDDYYYYGIVYLRSFRQVNRALCACLNPLYWRRLLMTATHLTEHVLAEAIKTNNLAHLKFFLEQAGVDVEKSMFSYGDCGNRCASPLTVDGRRCPF
jgi:hypothetical protein